MAGIQRVFVGLGNPGKKYEMTRHNLGYLVIQAFAHRHGWTLKEDKRFHAIVSKGQLEGGNVHLVLPTTYMNESGVAVKQYLEYRNLSVEDLVVVVDDVALPFGEMRLRQQGSAGGHNGLKSIQAHLGTSHYVRLRMGIGQEHGEGDLADYVLDTFSKDELKELPSVVSQGATILGSLLARDATSVMNTVNKKTKIEELKQKLEDPGSKEGVLGEQT